VNARRRVLNFRPVDTPSHPTVSDRIRAQAELVRQRNMAEAAQWHSLERTTLAARAIQQVLARRDWWADTTWEERYVIDELARALEQEAGTRAAFDAVKGAGP
jgi:hypothetical protein